MCVSNDGFCIEIDELCVENDDFNANGQDAVGATHSLTHWVRDRTQGVTGRFAIEAIVKKQTADVAEIFGLSDRGMLTVGMKADINCFDLAAMKVHEPYMMTDTTPGDRLH